MKTSQRTPTGRPHRVAELLRERLALILLFKCADPRLKEVTLTEVEMSPDLRQATASRSSPAGALGKRKKPPWGLRNL